MSNLQKYKLPELFVFTSCDIIQSYPLDACLTTNLLGRHKANSPGGGPHVDPPPSALVVVEPADSPLSNP